MSWSHVEVRTAGGDAVGEADGISRAEGATARWPLPGGLVLTATRRPDTAWQALSRAFVHEVRSPLNALGVYVDMLARPDEATPASPTSADLAERATRQLRRVDDLLQVFLSVWAPDRNADLSAVLTAAVRLAGHEAMRRGHAMTVRADEPAPVRSAPMALLDAFGHLFEALWSQPGSTAAQLTVNRSGPSVMLVLEGVALDAEPLRPAFALAGAELMDVDGRLTARFRADGE